MSLKSSGAKPMRKRAMVSAETPRPVRYSRARAEAGALRAAWKYCVAASCRSTSCLRMPACCASSGEWNSRCGSAMPLFCATTRTDSGETDVVQLHYEGENVTFFVTSEAVEVAVRRVYGERGRLFLVKRAQSGVVLGAGFAQFHVFADDFDDIGLLLDGLGEVFSHGVPRLRVQAGRLAEKFAQKICRIRLPQGGCRGVFFG